MVDTAHALLVTSEKRFAPSQVNDKTLSLFKVLFNLYGLCLELVYDKNIASRIRVLHEILNNHSTLSEARHVIIYLNIETKLE